MEDLRSTATQQRRPTLRSAPLSLSALLKINLGPHNVLGLGSEPFNVHEAHLRCILIPNNPVCSLTVLMREPKVP